MAKILALATLLFASVAHTAELGVTHTTYKEHDYDIPKINLRLGGEEYFWVSKEKPELVLVGQSIGKLKLYGAGVGLRTAIYKDAPWTAHLAFGYYVPKLSLTEHILDEAAVTYLNNRHGWRGGREFESTSLEVDKGFGGRISISREYPRFSVEASYRFLNLDSQVDAWTGVCEWPPGVNCHSWWQEKMQTNLSGVEVSLYVKL